MISITAKLSIYYSHLGLIPIALLLGMRHGMDLDHIAIIDSMTRRLPLHSKLSRCVGFLFSLGHGIVVVVFCILLNVLVKSFAFPKWIYTVMTSLSILLLIFFGWINIYSLVKTKNHGSKKIYLNKGIFKIFQTVNMKPINIMIVGGVFAISFDTISQVALFSMNTTGLFDILFSVLVGFTFTLGMMLTDGINGYVMSYLIHKVNRFSFRFSHVLTFSVGLFSTVIGVVELMSMI